MFLKSLPVYLITETPLHAGAGSELGIVDLPIQRERHTGFPKIESSGLKGSIRETIESKLNHDDENTKLVFGPKNVDNAHSGAISFSDARILLFPVKSVKGVFAWITCPQVLNQWKKDVGLSSEDQTSLPYPEPEQGKCFVSSGNKVSFDDIVILEEYSFTTEKKDENKVDILSKELALLIYGSGDNMLKYFREKMEKDVVVVDNDSFRDFVNNSTEVIARTKIDQKTGTVADGALWYEEYLPSDTVMYFMAFSSPLYNTKKGQFNMGEEFSKKEAATKEAEKVMEFVKTNLPEVFQIGGNATIGKGLVRRSYGNGGKVNE